MEKPDIVVENHGTVFQFHMKSRAAVEWMVDNLHYESWQMMGPNILAVDHRFAEDIVGLAGEAGLEVEISQ
jgi:hypothetical protein